MTTAPVRVVLKDAETGETVITTWHHPESEMDRKALKGWILRWRTGHKRQTGHKLTVHYEET